MKLPLILLVSILVSALGGCSALGTLRNSDASEAVGNWPGSVGPVGSLNEAEQKPSVFRNRYFSFSDEMPYVATSHMPTGSEVRPPRGYIRFCQRDARNCIGGTDKPAKIAMTNERWLQLSKTNDNVNQSIPEIEDKFLYHQAEYWTYPTFKGGDCEDLALQKQKILKQQGWPESALLLAVVRDWTGAGHAVLIVDTDMGDYVLDNKTSQIVPWQQTAYSWVKRQSQYRPSLWISLEEKFISSAIKRPINTAQIDPKRSQLRSRGNL
jgi:predicted transglutaminase-like cysteine proteinase